MALSESLPFQASVFGADWCSEQSPSSGGSGCLFHKASQSHDVCQRGHCERNLACTHNFSMDDYNFNLILVHENVLYV